MWLTLKELPTSVYNPRNTDAFWLSIGEELQDANGTPFSVNLTSPGTLLGSFAKDKWDKPVVILIDELSEILIASPGIQGSFFRTLQGLRHKGHGPTIASVAAGTFSIIHLTTTGSSLSPFNVSKLLTSALTKRDRSSRTQSISQLSDRDCCCQRHMAKIQWVMSDLFNLTFGSHLLRRPGMVCLFGRVVSNYRRVLRDTRTISFNKWQRFPTTTLFVEIYVYNTFRSLVSSLFA